MPLTNYQLLEENKKATLAFAKDIANAPPAVDPKSVSDKLQDARNSLKRGDFSAAISKLNEIKDNKHDIIWRESGDLGNGTRVLVRDARNVKSNPNILKEEQGERYAMQVLNEVRAGLDLLKHEVSDTTKKIEAEKKLLYLAEKSLNEVDKLGPTNIINYNSLIIDSLKKAGITVPDAKLNFAKELTSFQDEHKHIVTLTTVKDKDQKKHVLIEADIMLNGLTPDLIKQYQAIKDNKGINKEIKIDDKGSLDWYNNMLPYRKKLIEDAAGKILEGKHVMPTQLLTSVPGVRNAYDKITAIKDPEKKEYTIVSENLHCGTPASMAAGAGKKARQQIAQQNVEQLRSFTKDGKITLNTLNSGILGLKGINEGYIFNQLKKVSKNTEGVNFSGSPINDWRKVPGGGRDHTYFKELLQQMGTDLSKQNDLSKIGDYLKKGKSSKFTEAQILAEILSQERNGKIEKNNAIVLKAAIGARALIDTLVINEKGNVNLSVSNKMSIVETALMQAKGNLQAQEQLEAPRHSLFKIISQSSIENAAVRVDFCKSGKDRTGYVQTKNSHEASSYYLEVNNDPVIKKENLMSQVAGNHTQELAGIQGGTMGCHGIKQSLVFGLVKEDKVVEGIINQQTANFNAKIKTAEPKKETQLIKDFEVEFNNYEKQQKKEQTKIQAQEKPKEAKSDQSKGAREEKTNISKPSQGTSLEDPLSKNKADPRKFESKNAELQNELLAIKNNLKKTLNKPHDLSDHTQESGAGVSKSRTKLINKPHKAGHGGV